MAPTPSLQELIDTVRADSLGAAPLDQLAQASTTAGELGRLGDSLLDHFVDQCRKDGHSWSEISAVLGVSKQAAHKRYSAGPVTFERFTLRARQVVKNTAVEAMRHGSAATGTEHMLLALFTPAESLAALALTEAGLTKEACEQQLFGDKATTAASAQAAAEGAPTGASDDIDEALKAGGRVPYNDDAKNVLREAVMQALGLGHNYIGTEHLLLGLYGDPANPAARALVALGADAASIRARLIEKLAGYAKG
jgi:ATP-dependent Clp protease ATP-binding subunit ClpA